ncbi:MAG: MipA/OmpV family protein [Sulfitobacter sp.]|nr:MipA/OmpV family protein [Sulfitobacter sp.]
MMPRLTSTLFALILGLSAALPAAAQERSFTFALRGGLAVTPEYPGSDNYEPGPDIGFTFGSLSWGRLNVGQGIGNAPATGLSFRGAFRFIGERESSDYPELAGLNDIDATVELGFGAIYRERNWQAFGEVRKGIGGHDGFTGTLGANLVFRPTERFTLLAGPRVSFGDSDYASTYFGVSAAEAAASQFGQFNAGGGALGAGVEVQGTYRINDRWAVEGAVSYEKLLNDAADSPITAIGSEDQWRMRLGLSRTFNLRF